MSEKMYVGLDTSPSSYDKELVPELSVPYIIGFFSLDGNRTVHMDTTRLKYINNCTKREVNFPLYLGYKDTIVQNMSTYDKFNHLLTFALCQEARVSRFVGTRVQEAPVWCTRGLLSKLACSPYVLDKPWRIAASLSRGRIYLCMYFKDDQPYNQFLHLLRSTSWGYKFEQFMTSDHPQSDPDPHSVLNENEEFNVVHHTRLGKHTLIYKSETDGLACDNSTAPLDTTDYEGVLQYLNRAELVELKTCPNLDNPRQLHKFQKVKCIKWWLQSHLSGVNTIMCGFKDKHGVVREIEKFTKSDLLNEVKTCSPLVFINFIDSFLTYVKTCLEEEVQRRYPDCSDLQRLPLVVLHFQRIVGVDLVEVIDNPEPVPEATLPQHFLDQFGKSFNNNDYE